MKNFLICRCCLVFTLLVPQAIAQDDTLPFGHSQHGEVFNEGPRQKAVLVPGTGKIRFPIKTDSAEAKKFFNQGVGQLHGFWDFEAERSFRQVAALDPDCAMAYWGMAMANFRNPQRARGFIEEASKRKSSASKRNRMWIESLEKFFKEEKTREKTGEKIDEKAREETRLRNLVRDFEAIAEAYPDDIEAKAFLVKQIYYNHGKGHAIASHLAIDLLIREIMAKRPDHPAHHYRIHLWDREKPETALEAAASCGPAAPAIAHMWHMPGHIYSRLKRYDDAAWQQEASARIDHAHMMRYRIIPDDIHNFAHNNEWLIRNLNFLGRVDDAVALACNMIELPRLPKFKKDTETYDHPGGSWAFGRERLRDTLIRFEMWEELLACGKNQYLSPGSDAINDTEWHRFMGLASFESGDVASGEDHRAALESRLAELRDKQKRAAESAKEKATTEEKPEADTKKAVEAARKRFAGQIKSSEAALDELTVYALIFGDSPDAGKALELLKKLEKMDRSRRARLYHLAGDAEKASELIEQELKADPNQVQPLATQVMLHWEAERRKEALKAFTKLRSVAAHADLDLPALQRLEPVLKRRGITGDWREAKGPADDLGERPDLDTLGPFRWEPPLAPPLNLCDSKEAPHSLEDRVRPVLVIFYLGKGCTHCMEQLNAFAPIHERFADAGIDIVAVSTDTPEGLRETYRSDSEGEENPFPFPLLSAADLEAFHAYRAYDDFEDMPLHGTYLIDAQRRIRWQNISYEPFMHAEFLLEECVRLLNFDLIKSGAAFHPAASAD